MDALQFVVEIVKALAWPVVFLVMFYSLRGPLAALIPLIEEFKYKDFVVKFRAALERAKIEALPSTESELQALEVKKNGAFAQQRKDLYKAATLVPTAAVLQAWSVLEEAVLFKVSELGLLPAGGGIRGSSRLAHALLDKSAITLEDFKLFHSLRELRNQAAHKPDAGLTANDAEAYVDLALGFAERVSR